MNKRLYYLDNLRSCLTMLVIVHHTAIAYGASGSWFYIDVDQSHPGVSAVILTLFAAVNQAFFMWLFFFISAYFTPPSLDRKGTGKFLKDRLIRLGIPLLVFVFWLGPTTIYLAAFRNTESYAAFFTENIMRFKMPNFGPLWFTEALIYFAVLYVLFRAATRTNAPVAIAFPNSKTLLFTAVGLGVTAFLVRLVYPTGTGPWGLQFGYFPSYILLFVAGIIAYRNEWLEHMPGRLVKGWLRIALITILVLPVGFVLTGASGGGHGSGSINGGFNLPALFYAMWEPFVCIGICLGLLTWFRSRWNNTNKYWQALSGAAYTAYIIQPVVIVGWTILFHSLIKEAIIKFLIVAPLSVITAFSLAYLICKIPYAKKVL